MRRPGRQTIIFIIIISVLGIPFWSNALAQSETTLSGGEDELQMMFDALYNANLAVGFGGIFAVRRDPHAARVEAEVVLPLVVGTLQRLRDVLADRPGRVVIEGTRAEEVGQCLPALPHAGKAVSGIVH